MQILGFHSYFGVVDCAMLRRDPHSEEEDVLDFREGFGGVSRPRQVTGPYCLVGKLCAEKAPNSFALTDVMIKAFRAKGKLTARDWGNGLMIFSFDHEEDRRWVIRNQPWHFDNALFVIKPLSGKEQLSNITLKAAAFWIRIYDLPLLCQSTDTLISIRNRLGKLVAYENAQVTGPSEFHRIKVEIDITKPLRWGLNVKLDGEVLWIPLKYESLPAYCYCCGVLGHFYKNCKYFVRDEDLDPTALAYGAYLKASLGKRA
ncbi:hypothetical protein ACS0TY_015609 [Phlomoides rotata]